MRFLSYGDRIACGAYRLHSRFAKAVNFLCGEHLLAFVDTSVGAGPLNVVLRDLDILNGQRLFVGHDFIRIGETEFDLTEARRYDSAIAIPPEIPPGFFESGLACFRVALHRQAPAHSLIFLLDRAGHHSPFCDFDTALAERFSDGLRLLRDGRYVEGAHRIKGLGWGLTPSGDDFICGLLIALHLRQALFEEDTSSIIGDIGREAIGANPFSTAFLRCAQEGRVFERLQRVLTAILRAEENEIAEGAQQLASLGETSGSDLATGLIFELEKCDSLHDLSAWT
jgi:hypothetical protein